MSSTIEIKNKLLIINNQVKVPGHEPLSENTVNNLSIAMQGAASYIEVEKALKLIPGSRVIITYNAGPTTGSFGFDKFLELPSGPPPNGNQCPKLAINDYYKILRDAARVGYTKSDGLEIDCDGFSNFDNVNYNDFEKGLCNE